MAGVEYQVTKVDPTDPHTKGAVYQVHKVSEEIAATLGGKVYRARIVKNPSATDVAGKVYQIVLIGDPDDPEVKGKVYNAILTGGSEAVVVGPAVSPLALDDAVAGPLSYVKAFGGTENWSQATTSQGVYRYRFEPADVPQKDGARGHCVSTHFFDIGGVTTQDVGGVFSSTTYLFFIPNQDIDTVAKWTTYLAAQYAAGTPVIVLYPLVEPTTESVAGQPLQTADGDNVLEITQASLTGLELEAEYEKEVA